MLRELLSMFRSDNPLARMGEDFSKMLKLTYDMTTAAGDIYFGKPVTPEDRTQIYSEDIQVNQLERKIRKQVVTHLSFEGNTADVPYCLLLMSVVKDVERLGDYAKNLSEVVDLQPDPFPEDDIVSELKEIRRGVDEAFQSAYEIFEVSDHERATQYIRQGQDIAHRCDSLIHRIARAPYGSSVVTALVLGTRYYKRIGGHVTNLLTAVVMPLHKVDYYDEDEVPAHIRKGLE